MGIEEDGRKLVHCAFQLRELPLDFGQRMLVDGPQNPAPGKFRQAARSARHALRLEMLIFLPAHAENDRSRFRFDGFY